MQTVKSRELGVAIYEVGVSLSYGWGVSKDGFTSNDMHGTDGERYKVRQG